MGPVQPRSRCAGRNFSAACLYYVLVAIRPRRAKAKKDETRRLRDFVDAAWNCDPRVAAAHQEKKQAREDRKRAKAEARRKEAEEARRRAVSGLGRCMGGASCMVCCLPWDV